MKICIWCRKTENETAFNKIAHTFPASLGGESICENVCDKCNHYFGSPSDQSPAIEVVLKELLNASKYYLLSNSAVNVGNLKRFKSEFFNANWNARTLKLKPRYSLRKHAQEQFGRLFRRGLFKVYLEEREVQLQDALSSRFDFIREFARYNLTDYPIYIIKPRIPVILFSSIDTLNPVLRFSDYSDKMDKEFRIFEYPIMGHNFCIPTSRSFKEFNFDSYNRHIKSEKNGYGNELIEIITAKNFDFLFNYMNTPST